MSSLSPTTTSIPSLPPSNHKGKRTHRSWPQLPEELVRHIATFYLWNRATTTYTPATWDSRQAWHHRMVYTTLRDAFDLERNFMSVCPQWGLALEAHLFWQQVVTLVDPTDSLNHLALMHPHPDLTQTSSVSLRSYRTTPYRHFRHIINCSCLICRINLPATTRGLTLAKRSINTFFLGPIGLCREHDHRRLAFCGLCLRESPIYELAAPTLYTSADPQVAVLENEDEETWPGIEATCRNCRHEWLWKKASLNPRDQEAIGGLEMLSDDWETRQSVEGFVELAEGTISDVINLAREKHWLRKFTRLGDMMQQALAAAKFNNNYPSSRSSSLKGGDAAADYSSWDEEEDEEEDTELMQLEEGGVKDLALGDWARTRILDGYWISPADIWYRNTVPGKPLDMPAIHPCPWTIEDRKEPSHHPSPPIVKAEMPPSFGLCEQAFIAHGQQLRLILLPAMKNVVRRLAIECAISSGSEDPTLKASRMSLEEVARILREEEGVWFNGYDWVERRRNDDDARRQSRPTREEDARSTTSSSSGESVGSDATSPVLSTTTLQTTPSPPPLAYEKKDEERSWDAASVAEKVVIPIEPVLNPPRVLRSIPYIPITLTHLPQYSIDAFKNIWREACAPLYHCRCRICERAVAAANNANSPVQQHQQSPQVHQQQALPQQQKQLRTQEAPVEVHLQEVSEIEFVEEDGEETGEEEEYDMGDGEDDDDEGGDEEEEEEDDDNEIEEEERVTLRLPVSPVTIATTRKRSSDEIEDREEHTKRGTPPKRLRQELEDEKVKPVAQTGRIQRKRSSEELDEDEGHHSGGGGGGGVEKKKKRARLEENVVRLGSLSPATWGRSRIRSRSGSGSVGGSSPKSVASPPMSASAERSGSVDASTSEVGDEEVEDYAAWYNAVKTREIIAESGSASGSEDDDAVRLSKTPEGDGAT